MVAVGEWKASAHVEHAGNERRANVIRAIIATVEVQSGSCCSNDATS